MGAQPTSQAEARRKELGAFYTPPAMAEALVSWAVRSTHDRILDPSFGGLAFLQAARDRLAELGAQPDQAIEQIYGLELDPAAHGEATEGITDLDADRLLRADFFSVNPGERIPQCEAVVGNPPYIRYQDFKSSSAAAHRVSQAAGVRLTRLASSWAPFLVHATSFVTPGGRMAQVLPAELLHAQYAGEITDFLQRRFATITLVVFEERVFPGALEEVVLLFADGRGEAEAADARLLSFRTLNELDLAQVGIPRALTRADPGSRAVSREKLLVQLLPDETQDLYRDVAESEEVDRLGAIANVDIGAVTGANSFFLLSASESDGLAADLLRPAVSKAAQVAGARLRVEDHQELVDADRKAHMFVADAETPTASLKTAADYLEQGQLTGIADRYKCRTREPWWAVPLPKIGTPDLLLTYCSNRYPRLATNEAGVIQTNTIHGVSVNDPTVAPALAAGFYNSLTLLSAELVGRSYGGGVLKLEPTEAEAVLIPPLPDGIEELLPEVDRLVRTGDLEELLDLIDPLMLGQGLGLDSDQIALLRGGADRLRGRRKSRGKPSRS